MTQTTTFQHFSLLSLFILFSFLQLSNDSVKYDTGDFVSPCSLISTDELLDLIDLENSNNFKSNEDVLLAENLKMCEYGMETDNGEDFIIFFSLWHIEDIENSPMSNLETLVRSGFEFEAFPVIENDIYIEKGRTLILKKNQYVAKLEFTGFLYDEILTIGQLIHERLPD